MLDQNLYSMHTQNAVRTQRVLFTYKQSLLFSGSNNYAYLLRERHDLRLTFTINIVCKQLIITI